MNKTYTLLIALYSLVAVNPAQATLDLAPPSFLTRNGPAVFVDFTKANYKITYDKKSKSTTVTSTIDFYAKEAGFPIFDLTTPQSGITLDGITTDASLTWTPDGVTAVRVLKDMVYPGEHQMVITHQLTEQVKFGARGVTNFFKIRDLTQRKFLEQYIPSNLEYDQFPMTFDLHFKNFKRVNQRFMTNGVITEIAKDHHRIEFPEYYTASSPFYHTAPKGGWATRRFNIQSISGATIPVTIYKTNPFFNLRKFSSTTKTVFSELENDYGAFGHASIHVYANGFSGGMEHAGATETTLGALDHELFHCYFAKGVMPANGNAGWIDEAFASWRDRGYPRYYEPGYISSNMGGQSPYTRATDRRAYSLGMRFIAYLDSKVAFKGGMKKFMREYYAENLYKLITVSSFQAALESFSGLDLKMDFDRYILGVYGNEGSGETKAFDEAESFHHEHQER
jgi:hypothetical protein